MEMSVENIAHLETFSAGMLLSVLMILAFFFLIHSSRHPLYWRTYGYIMLFLSLFSVMDEAFILFGKYGVEYFTNIEKACIMMVVPMFHVWLHSMVHQSDTESNALTKMLLGNMPLVFCLCLLIIGFDWALYVAYTYITIYAIVYVIVFIRKITRFNRLLSQAYSDTENRNLSWIRNMAILCLLLFVSFMCFAFSVIQLASTLHALFCSVIFVYIAYKLYFQRPVNMKMMNRISTVMSGLTNLNADTDNSQKSDDASPCMCQQLSDDIIRMIGRRLDVIIKDEKVYLNSDLTINELAVKVGTNTAYMSCFINKVVGKSFNTYINELRLAHVENLLLTNKDMSIDEVAHKSGFSSLATMQRVFGLRNNCTASQYRQLSGNVSRMSEDDFDEKILVLPDIGKLSNTQMMEQFCSYCELRYPKYTHILQEYESSLTHRDMLLCMLVALGYDNDKIAAALELSTASLNVTRSRLRAKLRLQRMDSLKLMVTNLLNQNITQTKSYEKTN